MALKHPTHSFSPSWARPAKFTIYIFWNSLAEASILPVVADSQGPDPFETREAPSTPVAPVSTSLTCRATSDEFCHCKNDQFSPALIIYFFKGGPRIA